MGSELFVRAQLTSIDREKEIWDFEEMIQTKDVELEVLQEELVQLHQYPASEAF